MQSSEKCDLCQPRPNEKSRHTEIHVEFQHVGLLSIATFDADRIALYLVVRYLLGCLIRATKTRVVKPSGTEAPHLYRSSLELQ